MQEVQLRDAKAQFSAVVDKAAGGEASIVTRHGEKVAVVLGYAAWQRLVAARPGFGDLLLAFPEDSEIARDPAPPRDPGL
jgi:prevent-host-death family protein